MVWEGRLPEDEHTLTIRPQPRSAIAGAAARISRIGAITWSSHCSCHSASASSSSGLTELVPALLTRASIRPKRSRQAFSTRSPASGSVMSHSNGVAARRVERGLQALGAAADEQEGRSLAREGDGGGAPDPARGSGDHAGAFAQTKVHGTLVPRIGALYAERMARRSTLRASDADREQVAERLRNATGEGRLLADELEERLGAVFAARTYGELDAVVADLPRRDVPERRGAPRRTLSTVRSLPPVALVLLVPLMIVVAAVAVAVAATIFALWVAIFVITLGAFGHRRGRYYYQPVRYTRSVHPGRSWWA